MSTAKSKGKKKGAEKASKPTLVKKEQSAPIYTAQQEMGLLREAAQLLSQPMTLSERDSQVRSRVLQIIVGVNNSINEKEKAAEKAA